MRRGLGVLLTVIVTTVVGCASQASHFWSDIASSSTICKGRSLKSQVELVQCIDALERPIVFKDLPNLLYAYDVWNSARLSAATDYDNQVRSAREKAWVAAHSQIDASANGFTQAVAGIWPQTQTDRDSIKQEADKAGSQCTNKGTYKSGSMVVNYTCDRDAKLPVFERRIPAAASSFRTFYNEALAIASVYDKAAQSVIQVASVKFNETIGPPKSTFRSQVQLALQDDAAATARQRQETADGAATLLMLLGAGLSGYNQGRGYDQPSHPPISTSCTTTNGITNCLSF